MKNNKKTIHFIFTGGTVDSFYDGTKDTAVPLKHSAIPAFIASLKLYVDTLFTEVCMKDSRNVTPADRSKVLKIIQNSPHEHIIITHGTYTMPDTAKYLSEHLKKNNKTIILTGAMIPLSFPLSDAPFNLGFTIAKIQDLPAGIYVCMNGRIFSSEEVRKDISQGRFASTFGKE